MVGKADSGSSRAGGMVEGAQQAVGQANTMLGEVRETLKRAEKILADAEQISGNAKAATEDLAALRAEVDANLRKISGLIEEINRKWPFERKSEIRLPYPGAGRLLQRAAAAEWQTDAGSLQVFQRALLAGDTKREPTPHSRAARAELARTGRADLVARAELIRALRRSRSLVFERCAGFERSGTTPATDERPTPITSREAAPRAGRASRSRSWSPQACRCSTGRDHAAGHCRGSRHRLGQGWRRPLLAWLGVQLKRAEAAGDSETAARTRRRIELVSG